MMRTRLTYLFLSPRTPAWIAAKTTELLAILTAAAAVIAIVSGWASVALFTVVVETGRLLGAGA